MAGQIPDVLVIGAGVCGLSSAIELLRAGLAVTVYAADPPLRTTSAAAGAIWGPHLVAEDERVARWAGQTLTRLRELARDPATGVREAAGVAASAAGRADPPGFAAAAGALAPCDPAGLPRGYARGWRYRAPVVAMPTYLDHLTDEVLRHGGQLHFGPRLRALEEAAELSAAPVIVNCAGMGARDLAGDPELVPVRGQVVVVANPGLTDFFVGERDEPGAVTYVFPHGPLAVLGGTQQPGETSMRPDPAIAGAILRECVAAEPALAGAPVLAHRVGLRPVRPRVSLGPARGVAGRHVIANYGHGGAGVTLSWGCAREVAEEAGLLLGGPGRPPPADGSRRADGAGAQ